MKVFLVVYYLLGFEEIKRVFVCLIEAFEVFSSVTVLMIYLTLSILFHFLRQRRNFPIQA